MVLLIDMGNTDLTLAAWGGTKAYFDARIPTNRSWSKQEYTEKISAALAGWQNPVFEGCALSSVVPVLTQPVAAAMQHVTGQTPVLLNYSGRLSFSVNTRDEIGADMLAGAEAVKARFPLPAIVADLGTCTTFCAQNAAGDVLGVAIAPGVALGLEAMVGRASHLCQVAFEPPSAALGITTAQSMQSGVVLGAASMLDGMFRRIANEMPQSEGQPALILTGGLAGLIAPFCELPVTVAPDLLMQGLYQYYLNNKKPG